MNSRRPIVGILAALSSLVLAACADSDSIGPNGLPTDVPLAAILDGANGGNSAFFFLPPLVDNPNPSGVFNGSLQPTVEICELDNSFECTGNIVASFDVSDISISTDQYQLNWDTDGLETSRLNVNKNYRIGVFVGELQLGFLDVNPQRPSGESPGDDEPGLYAFRVGETIPVKFWIGQGVFCDTSDPLVIECAEAAVFDELGGSLSIAQMGDELGVFLPPGGLPAENPEVIVIVERISNAALEAIGETCIPGLDAPQFGPCFRIRTVPALEGPLEVPAVVSICVDLSAAEFAQLKGHEQQERIQTFRAGDDGNIQSLANTFSTICEPEQFGLLDVPESGLMRYAALGVNALGRAFGPQPLGASDLGLGSLTINFSRFRWGLPARLSILDGDGQVEPAGTLLPENPRVLVTDAGGETVEGATVHFGVTAGGGSSTPMSMVTGADGIAEVQWTLGSDAGENTLEATGFGLLSPDDAFVDHQSIELTQAGVATFTATAVGAPANVNPADGDGQTGVVGQSLAQPIVIDVTDINNVPVGGAQVVWSAAVDGDAETDSDGSAQGTWTLGTTSGTQTATATVNGITATFTATAIPGAAATITKGGDGQTGAVGGPLPTSISVTVADVYGNVRVDDHVSWTITVGGGNVSPTSSSTDANGVAHTTWTMGALPGANTARADVEGLSAIFTATGVCFDGYGSASIDGTFGVAEWACAESFPFTANISGGGTPAEVHWMNDGANLYMSVRVQQSTFDSKNSLRIDFDNDGDGIHEQGDDAFGYDADAGVFFDEYLTTRCANNGQSGCGSDDGGTPDGAGAAANDGTWTTYELAHPLASGDSNDFSLTPGDVIGFFGTLRVGNGAQGNTQFLGFRVFESIQIVGLP